MGGLGNQLFQLAAALSLRESTERTICIDLSEVQSDSRLPSRNTARSCEVDDLLRPLDIKTDILRGKTLNQLLARVAFLGRLQERNPYDNVLNRVNSQTRLIRGYFQRYVIVERVWPELLNAMSQSDVFRPALNASPKKQIAVHLRYGDYASNPRSRAYHGLTLPEYYASATSYLESQKCYEKIVIVSDDRVRAKGDFLKFYDGDLVVEASNGNNHYEDLTELASSAGLVISNSSFSWWSAWIAHRRHDAQVIAPNPWFAHSTHDINTLVPPTWTLRPRTFQT